MREDMVAKLQDGFLEGAPQHGELGEEERVRLAIWANEMPKFPAKLNPELREWLDHLFLFYGQKFALMKISRKDIPKIRLEVIGTIDEWKRCRGRNLRRFDNIYLRQIITHVTNMLYSSVDGFERKAQVTNRSEMDLTSGPKQSIWSKLGFR